MAKISPDQAKSEPVKREQLIYIGPNVPGGMLQRYQVFRGGKPEHLKDLFEKCPALQGLFVQVTELAVAEKALGTAGTVENTLYREAAKFFAKGGK